MSSEIEEVRKCEACNVEKDIEEFYTEKAYAHCEECRALLNKQKKEENKKKNAEIIQQMDLLINDFKNKISTQTLNTTSKIKIAKFISKNNL